MLWIQRCVCMFQSTGDSLDEDDDDDKVAMETKKNTAFNEITDKNKPVHERHDVS